MPAPSESLFLEAICAVVRENESFVPPEGKGSLYLRPLLMGSGPILGLGSAPSFTFLVYAAAVGSYFKVQRLSSFAERTLPEIVAAMHHVMSQQVQLHALQKQANTQELCVKHQGLLGCAMLTAGEQQSYKQPALQHD